MIAGNAFSKFFQALSSHFDKSDFCSRQEQSCPTPYPHHTSENSSANGCSRNFELFSFFRVFVNFFFLGGGVTSSAPPPPRTPMVLRRHLHFNVSRLKLQHTVANDADSDTEVISICQLLNMLNSLVRHRVYTQVELRNILG